MSRARLTWEPPRTDRPSDETAATRRTLFGLHLVGSLMILLAVWPSGWRLGEPALGDPFAPWWGVEVLFLGLVALQFGAARWRGGCAPEPEAVEEDLLWILLLAASSFPTGLAAYRAGPVPPAPPAHLLASLGAELLFFASFGRSLRRAGLGEPVRGLAAWGAFLLLALGVWLPGVRAWEPFPGVPLPALGPVPFPLLWDQPRVRLGFQPVPLALVTAAFWMLAAAGLHLLGRRLERGRHP